jgi:GT2 family glycosyltransferase
MSQDSVCAIVVNYNRKELLLECLESLKNQSRPLNSIYIIDNASTDGTGELLLEKEYITELTDKTDEDWITTSKIKNSVDQDYIDLRYVRMGENTGGAGGFHEGVKRAYHDGYDWLWLMDDDAEPPEDALEKLAEYLDEENVSALAGVVRSPDNEYYPLHRKFFDFNNFSSYLIVKTVEPELISNNKVIEIDDSSFVGILINRKAISKIGFPKKELFVFHDDSEYSIRLRSVGRILLITDSYIYHKDQSGSKQIKKQFLGHTFDGVKYENFWIRYFAIRNNIWLLKQYRRPLPYFWFILVASWVAWMFNIVLFKDNILKRMQMVNAAYYNGLKGNFDNKKPKEILYS